MMMHVTTLDSVRPIIRTGDLMVFGGRILGRFIEAFTESNQSHVAVCHRDGHLLMLSETKARGMGVSLMTKTIDFWPRAWLLRLKKTADTSAVTDLAAWATESKVPYDYRAIIQYYRGLRPPEDTSRLYCSEWSAWAVHAGGTPLATIELTPIELCQRQVFESSYCCLKYNRREGPLEIRAFNTVPPLEPPSEIPVLD